MSKRGESIPVSHKSVLKIITDFERLVKEQSGYDIALERKPNAVHPSQDTRLNDSNTIEFENPNRFIIYLAKGYYNDPIIITHEVLHMHLWFLRFWAFEAECKDDGKFEVELNGFLTHPAIYSKQMAAGLSPQEHIADRLRVSTTEMHQINHKSSRKELGILALRLADDLLACNPHTSRDALERIRRIPEVSTEVDWLKIAMSSVDTTDPSALRECGVGIAEHFGVPGRWTQISWSSK